MSALTARIFMPDGNASGPVYLWSPKVADLMVASIPPSMSLKQLPESVAARGGLVIAVEDGQVRVKPRAILLEGEEPHGCVIVGHPGTIFRGDQENIAYSTKDYLDCLGEEIARQLGGQFLEPLDRSRTVTESNRSQAGQDAIPLVNLMKAVFGPQLSLGPDVYFIEKPVDTPTSMV